MGCADVPSLRVNAKCYECFGFQHRYYCCATTSDSGFLDTNTPGNCRAWHLVPASLFRLICERGPKHATLYTDPAMTITRMPLHVSRRALLLFSGALPLSALSCNKSTPDASAAVPGSAAAATTAAAKPAGPLTVGFI